MKKRNTIILSGGGSGGPVVPLLALVDEWRKQGSELSYLWVGTKDGPEKQMAKEYGIPILSIPGAKFRRYWSIYNIADILNFVAAFFKSLYIIFRNKPKIVSSAGGFISVPLSYAAWLLRVPVHIHQQDVRAGLANKLMAPIAKLITVTFEKSLSDYPQGIHTGNPARAFFKTVQAKSILEIKKELKLDVSKKLFTVLGGGTGSEYLNEYMRKEIKNLLTLCQIVHISGSAGRIKEVPQEENYYHFDFVDGEKIAKILQASDIVVSRAGLGTITELSFLKKPVIVIPLPDSHQEDNAELLKEQKAAIILSQKENNYSEITQHVKYILDNNPKSMVENFSNIIPHNAGASIIKKIEEVWR